LVPLTDQAIAILDEFAFEGTWPSKGLVFSVTGKTPISGFSKAKNRLDALVTKGNGAELEPWRIHDLRRTVATGFQRLGVRFEVTEAVLNHLSGSRSGLPAVYQRHDWADEKREALEAWARHIQKLAGAQ
jgi:integrase